MRSTRIVLLNQMVLSMRMLMDERLGNRSYYARSLVICSYMPRLPSNIPMP